MTAQVGIVGYCCSTGLGIVAQDFYKHLPFARWLVAENTFLGVDRAQLDSSCRIVDSSFTATNLEAWLKGLDAVFSVEHGYVPGLWTLAKARGVKIVLMPNAEWFRPDAPEMQLVDSFIAPTLACAEMLEQTGFGSKTSYIPHAVDGERFAFRRRERAEIFLHCRGLGGYKARKGTDIFLEAARRCPEVRFIIQYQRPLETRCPGNVELLGPTAKPEEQYLKSDVAIQPSRWEGAGLQILEAMSCGLPTIVPDGPPMNEYPADKLLCIQALPNPVMIENKPWVSWEMDVNSLVQTIKQLHHQPIAHMSERARAQMELRSWPRLKPDYMRALGMT